MGEDAAAEQADAHDAHRLGTDAVLDDAADQVAEAEAEQHEGGHQVDRSGLPAEEVDGGLLEHAPDVQDAHAQLDHQTANDGGQHLGLTGF